MDEQLSLFDIEGYPDFRGLSLTEITQVIGDALGVKLEEYKGRARAQLGKLEISVCLSKYTSSVQNGEPHISAWWDYRGNGYEGGGAPCDSIEKAVEFLRSAMIRKGEKR